MRLFVRLLSVAGACVAFSTAAAPPSAGLSRPQEFDCLVEPRQTLEIRSPVDGLIENVLANRGDLVRKGQVVVQLESGPERAAVAVARARADQQGAIRSATARVDLATRKLTRARDLYNQNFVSLNATDEAGTELNLAQAQLREATESQRLAELELKRAQEQLAMRTIRSPINGVVVERLMWPGEFATTNIKQPILKLAEVNPLNVEVVLPVAHFGIAKTGRQALVRLEPPVNGEYPALIKVVDPVIHAGSGTFGVRLELPNPKFHIPAGAKCRVRFDAPGSREPGEPQAPRP